MFIELFAAPKTPLSKGVGSPFRWSGGIRAGSTNSPKTLQNNGVAVCGIPPSRLFKATHLSTRHKFDQPNWKFGVSLTFDKGGFGCSKLFDKFLFRLSALSSRPVIWPKQPLCHPGRAERVEGSWHRFHCICHPNAQILRLRYTSLRMTYLLHCSFLPLGCLKPIA